MSQLIDFSNYIPDATKNKVVSEGVSINASGISKEESYNLTLNILVNGNPGKLLFTSKETSKVLGVGEEFIRRRIKSNKIQATYFGDKPMLSITELARIITEGSL